MAPFQDLEERAAAKEVPAITGVPACDLLLAQHRRCLARVAPDPLPGVDAMASELKAKAARSDAGHMSGECKALRRLAEGMWTAECLAAP